MYNFTSSDTFASNRFFLDEDVLAETKDTYSNKCFPTSAGRVNEKIKRNVHARDSNVSSASTVIVSSHPEKCSSMRKCTIRLRSSRRLRLSSSTLKITSRAFSQVWKLLAETSQGNPRLIFFPSLYFRNYAPPHIDAHFIYTDCLYGWRAKQSSLLKAIYVPIVKKVLRNPALFINTSE